MLRLLRRVRPRRPEDWYLVVCGRRVCFASHDRSLAEAFYHGQDPATAVLLKTRVLKPKGERGE